MSTEKIVANVRLAARALLMLAIAAAASGETDMQNHELSNGVSDRANTDTASQINLPDEEIAVAYEKAATQNVLAAVNPKVFFGYWSVCADGVGFGHGCTYPALDGHQMADALLWLGAIDVVKANWDYVRSFQRPNGQLPFAILPSMAGQEIGPEGCRAPVDSNGGLYRHWVPVAHQRRVSIFRVERSTFSSLFRLSDIFHMDLPALPTGKLSSIVEIHNGDIKTRQSTVNCTEGGPRLTASTNSSSPTPTPN